MSRAAGIPISTATDDDLPALGSVFAAAFQDDPIYAWVTPDPERRRAVLPGVFVEMARMYVDHGMSHLAADGAAGALWAPAGVDPFDDEAAVVGFAERIGAVLGDEAERLMEVGTLLQEHHPQGPCAYLQLLGVTPERQGRGLGGLMLRGVLDDLDAAGTPAYLEATTHASRRLYARHGFSVVNEAAVPGAPPLWPMWREPAPAGG